MASLKELRNRIASVKATQKITKAKQMVAAAKLRRAQEAAEAARPYAERMGAVLRSLAGTFAGRDDAPKLLAGTGSDQSRHLLLVATADRGLCGAFNSSIARAARDHALKLQAEGKDVSFFCVGKKGYDILRRTLSRQIVGHTELREVKQLSFADAQKIAGTILGMFEDGKFDVCTLFFARFRSVISQVPTALQLIPAQVDVVEAGEKPAVAGASYEYEPDEESILTDLLPRNIAVQIFSALLENAAGEQGASMTAMDNATRNAGDMISDLTIVYNRSRQAQITKELIEIISGAEAV